MRLVREGFAKVHASVVQGTTALTCVSHKAPARLMPLRTPGANAAGAARVVVSSLGGGLLAGDVIDLDVAVDRGATLHLGTQASTKIYKGAPGAKQTLDASVEADALLVVAPDPVTPFRAAT